MKKQFQSKTYPQGSRTIWRYLSALILLFSLGITQMWGAYSPVNNPATKKYGDITFLDVANTKANGYVSAVGDTYEGDSTVTYGVYYVAKTLAVTSWFNSSDGSPASNHESTGYSITDAADYGFFATSSTSSDINYGGTKCHSTRQRYFYVTGATSVAAIVRDGDTKGNKYAQISIQTVAEDGTLGTATVLGDYGSKTAGYLLDGGALDPTKYYKISFTSQTTSNCFMYQIRLSKYIAPATTYTVTYKSGDGSGSDVVDSDAKTVKAFADCSFTAPTGYEFKEWQDGSSNVVAAGASVSADMTLTAIYRLIPTKYTVTYNLNGASGDAPTETDKAAGDAFNLAAAPSWAGHVFDGWLCSADAAVKAAGSSYTMTAANTTFTAQWHEIDCKIYSLTGGIGSAEVTADASNAEVTESLLKLASTNARIKLTPGEGTFKAGDVITISGTPGNWSKKFSVYVYAANGSTKLATLTVANAGDLPLLSGTLSGDAEYVYLARIDGTTQNIYSCEVHRSCAEGATAGLSYATASVEKTTGDAAFTNALTNTNSLVIAGYGTSDASVATVNVSNGQVTVVGDGTATITAYSAVQTKEGVLYAAGTATYTLTVTSADDDATLSALSVTGLTLSPTFASATEDYTVTKEYGAADPVVGDVTATPTSGTASAEVAWDSENHKFVITVTAGDNTTTKTYNITVNEAEAPKSLSRVLFSNGFDAFIDNANHTVMAYYLAGTSAPTATTITAGAGTAGELSEGKIRVTGADDSYVDYIVTLEAVTPNTTTVAEADPAGEFAGDEAWVKNGLLIYGNAAGYDGGDGKKWYVNRRLTKSGDAADDQRVIAGWVRSYFFVGNASKFIMTVGGNNAVKYSIDGGDQVANASGTLEIALTKGNHMIEVVSNQSNGDCRLSAPKLVELPPTYTVTYMPGDGEGAWVVDEEATVVADCPAGFTAPEGKIFNGWKDGENNDVEVGASVSASMALTAQWIGHYAVTFNMQGHGAAIDAQDIIHGSKAVKPADPIAIGWEFGGWYTEAACENEFDFNTAITAATPLFAKWTAFDGCVLSYPATSGDAIAVGDEIDMQTGSFGATMIAVSKDENCTLAYESYGLSFASSGNTSRVKVTLDHDIAIGTKITVTLVANGDKGSNRALDLYNSAVAKKAMLGWTSSDDYLKYDVATFSHTVTAEDAMAGTNEFYLYRNNSVYLQCLKVEACGDAIIYHNLTSAVDPTGKGTVTLGASSVREGYTTTATYSDIDPLYEFVNWTVSGEGASIENATANPATITVGTADAVVTLNLQLIPVKFTVNYYDGETPMGTEEVAVNENPTASEIDTDKRHYTFQGWAETDGGSVVALNTITSDVAATINLYAVYAPVACPTEGTVFSMEFDNSKAPESTVKVAKNGGSLDLADYATLVGGNAVINNTETSDKDAISTGGKFLLTATKEVMKIELECAIATGDVIRIPDNNQKYVLSTSNAKTGTYQAQTSSQHEFEVTAAWNGVDDLYILYDGSSLNFTKVYVLRPYTVSFDLQGHGDAIDVQKLVEGKKVVAPTAPTADGWDFAGWYKEAACTNAWDFDNDVVEGTISIYAKWTEHVTNDATLKSLKYGNTAIELEEGVYTYAVELAAAVAAVPALSAETNAALATKVITNAEAFEAGQATSTVLVTAEDGATKLTYTVNFSKASALPQVNVTETTTWNFATAIAGSTSMENQTDVVLANIQGINNNENFNSQALKGTFNKMPGNYFQGSVLHFHTTVPGMLTVEFSGTNDKARRLIVVNNLDVTAAEWEYNSSSAHQTKSVVVPAGDVTLRAFEGENAQNARIYNMTFDTNIDPINADYTRDVDPQYYGTICLPKAGVMAGATLFEVAYFDAEKGKVFFDEVLDKSLVAGRPYIFLTDEGNESIGVYYTATTDEPAGNYRGLYGTLADINEGLNAEGIYLVSRNQILHSTSPVSTLKANRAYLKIGAGEGSVPTPATAPAPAPGRRRISMGVNGKGTATGIDAINASEKPMKIMIDGQIYILRGQKMYDATGRLVK